MVPEKARGEVQSTLPGVTAVDKGPATKKLRHLFWSREGIINKVQEV